MKQKVFETLGYVINAGSIASFFFLAGALGVTDVPLSTVVLAWLLFGLGILLVMLSTMMLIRNRGAGLIERGIFGIVRHPMYVGAMLLFLSWIGFAPHWIIALISIVNIVIVYAYMLQGERFNLAKFGDAYARYMERVPRLDLLTGSIRALRR
jgi:protein-S-isoprenylcysteine O-methyltransferase Ste14